MDSAGEREDPGEGLASGWKPVTDSAELSALRAKVDLLCAELAENNRAMAMLAKSTLQNRVEYEHRIGLSLANKLLPIIANLKKRLNQPQCRLELDIMEGHLKEITADALKPSECMPDLTATEMQVAAMIRNGMQTRKIAAYMNVAINTVKTHRKNIRKKLNLKNSPENLRECLERRWS